LAFPFLLLAGFFLTALVGAADQPLPIGHRGMVQNHPENTLPGFEACLRKNVGFELDVRRTKDGRLVVLHDPTLERTTTGFGRIDAIGFADLRKLDAGSKYNARFAGAKVPELGEVFRLVRQFKEPRALVCIDLKIKDTAVEHDVVKLAQEFTVL